MFSESLSNGVESQIIFLDISKAFDRVWHEGLTFKLKKCGISGNLLEWSKNYLSDREQRVQIRGQMSSWTKLKAGVPQGSVLGPLFFLIFINDLIPEIKNSVVRLFADDTCLIVSDKCHHSMARKLNEDLLNIETWSNKWLVDFNPEKTESLLISNKNKFIEPALVNFKGKIINQVTSHKHLGMILTNNLMWNEHVDQVIKSCAPMMNSLRLLKNKLDRHSLEVIFTSFIRPKLEYGDILLAGSPKHTLDKINDLEQEALRLITGAIKRSSRVKVILEYGKALIHKRRSIHCLSLMYKLSRNSAPNYLQNIIANFKPQNPRPSRNPYNYSLPQNKSSIYQRTFFPQAIKLWNSLDHSVKSSPNIKTFKSKLNPKQKHNTLYYYGSRWANIHHARMRMGCSLLNHDLYMNIHVLPSPACACGYYDETVMHYFYSCPTFNTERNKMKIKLQARGILWNKNIVNILLYGDKTYTYNLNVKIFDIVHEFMAATKRFNP
jgi:hypothetical protein